MSNNKPVPTGKYAVGTMTYSVYGDRNIACRVYFPARKEDTEGLQKVVYMSYETCKGMNMIMPNPVSYKKICKDGGNFSECYEKAKPVPGEKFPLIIFNHGAGSFRESNSFLCIELASQGYVVICIGHPRFCACVELDNGTFEWPIKNLAFKTYKPYVKGAMKLIKLTKAEGTDEELADKLYQFQTVYCEMLLSEMPLWIEDTKRAVAYAKDNLSDMIDFSKGIGATGHSFGGAAAYILCHNEPEFACGINIDGMTAGGFGEKVLEKPFLQICSDKTYKVVTRTHLYTNKPNYQVRFRDMEHMGFCDLKYALPMKSQVGALPPDVLHEHLCKCHLEFFDAYLKGTKEAPDLNDDDAVKVTKYN